MNHFYVKLVYVACNNTSVHKLFTFYIFSSFQTDLLVRQKQVTVGMPPNNEYTITAPLPEPELRQLIHEVIMLVFSKIRWKNKIKIFIF